MDNFSSENTNCLNCSLGYYKTEDSNTNCILESLIKPNYYKNTSDNIYYKCHPNCYNCTSGFDSSTGNMNCNLCKEGFYKLTGTNNCYNRTLADEEASDKLEKCYERCQTCDKFGDITDMHCLSCKQNLTKEQGTHPLQLKLTKNGNCIEGCENNLLLTLDGDCVSNCPNRTYKFSKINTCLKDCPSNYEINQEKNECIEKSMEKTTSSEFKTQIMTNISNFISTTNLSKVINGSDFIAVILTTDSMDPKVQLNKGISAIELGNCTNVMKEFYNISQNESLYVLNIESKKMRLKNQVEIMIIHLI